MDILSDVLRTVRLKGSIYFTADFYHPWAFSSPQGEELMSYSNLKAECITLFHIVAEGSCWFQPRDGEPFLAEKGSIVIFPHGCEHTMSSQMGIDPISVGKLFAKRGIDKLTSLEYGGNGAPTHFICGYLLCDQKFNPLIGALPDVLVVRPNEWDGNLKSDESGSLDSLDSIQISSDSWLDKTIEQLAHEVQEGNMGSATIRTRLTELMYVEVLRRLMKSLPAESKGWLAAIRDPEVGRALRIIHDNPGQKWSVEELAREVGVSRSAFAQRFTDLIGESPMRYLTSWRIQLAKNLLLQPELSTAMVAEKVGYDSDIAFSRAFKRHVGSPPARWKKGEFATA